MESDKRTQKLRLVSRIILLATLAVWAVWDIIPSLNAGRGDTLSENVRDWSRGAWAVPFGWGGLTGHFFLNIGQPENYHLRFYILAGIFAVAIAANLIMYFVFDIKTVPLWGRGVALGLGVILGIVLWAQNP